MKKFIFSVITITLIGLVMVYGEVEAMKIGYDIRQLDIRKREITHQMKEAEYHIAQLTAPERLEESMRAYQVELVKPKLLKVAKLPKGQDLNSMPAPSAKGNTFLNRFFISSAQADTTR